MKEGRLIRNLFISPRKTGEPCRESRPQIQHWVCCGPIVADQGRYPNRWVFYLHVNYLLNVRIDVDQARPEVWMINHGNLRVPCHRHKDSVDTGADWSHEGLTYL